MIQDLLQLFLSVVTVAVVGLTSVLTRTLDRYGFVAGVGVGLTIVLFGGWRWFVVLLAFFVSAGFFTRYKFELKRQMGVGEGREGARSWQNVAANGAVASVFAVAYGLTYFTPFALGYLGAVGASAADTLATEVGLLNPYEPRLITNLSRQVSAGTSGAVSPYGEIASLVGAGLISSIAWLLDLPSLNSVTGFLVVLIAGFMGSTFDSLLGATVQALYRCPVCDALTEKRVHCNTRTQHFSGNRFLDNNAVNLLATAFGGLSASILHMILCL